MRQFAWLAAFGALGCTHHHGSLNAPGNVRVLEPPARLEVRDVEPPADPGEQMVVLSYGPFVGGGAVLGDGPARAAFVFGPELGVQYGILQQSHRDDQALIFPDRSLGVNVGWTLVAASGHERALYAELQLREGFTFLAPGWAWDPEDTTHGPQATLGFGPFYARATHVLDGETQIHGGLLWKGWSSWIWSR